MDGDESDALLNLGQLHATRLRRTVSGWIKETPMMHPLTHKKRPALIAVVSSIAAMAAFTGSSSAAAITINLCAVANGSWHVTSTAPAVPIWSFAIPTTPGDCTTATASLPGQTLIVNSDDTVTLHITNALPAVAAGAVVTHTLSMEIPGISLNAGPTDIPLGGTVDVSFTNAKPGTYIYQSAGDSGRQEAMGLSGALIVRPAGAPGQAYATADTPVGVDTSFAVESTLVLSQLDPNFNNAPDTAILYDRTAIRGADPASGQEVMGSRGSVYRATWWLINGKAYPDTAGAIPAATAGQRVLLRYVNAGYDNTAMMLLGAHQNVVGRDANPLKNPMNTDADTIPAGGTEDAIVTMPAGGAPSSQGFPLFNRNLHVTNPGPPFGPTPIDGGMLTFLHS
jgi:FtsP/CotA-like multicopper oxidase with cupredoxin domain